MCRRARRGWHAEFWVHGGWLGWLALTRGGALGGYRSCAGRWFGLATSDRWVVGSSPIGRTVFGAIGYAASFETALVIFSTMTLLVRHVIENDEVVGHHAFQFPREATEQSAVTLKDSGH